MDLTRRNFIIRSIGAAICAGLTPPLIASLLPGVSETGPIQIGNRTFYALLNEYIPKDLLIENMLRDDYMLRSADLLDYPKIYVPTWAGGVLK